MRSELFSALPPTLACQNTKGDGDGEENGDGVGDEDGEEEMDEEMKKKQLIEDVGRDKKECLVELKKGFPATIGNADRISCD